MPPPQKDSKLQLGEPWASKLADFCAAHYNAPAKEIIKAALDDFIDRRLKEEPEMRKRFEAARGARLKGKSTELTLLKP